MTIRNLLALNGSTEYKIITKIIKNARAKIKFNLIKNLGFIGHNPTNLCSNFSAKLIKMQMEKGA